MKVKERGLVDQRLGDITRGHEQPVKFEEQSLIYELLSHLEPNGRIGREVFAVTVLIIIGSYFAVTVLGSVAYYLARPLAPDEAVDGFIMLTYFVVLLPLISLQFIKRLHDFGRPGWHVILLFIPIWFLFELFKAFFMRGQDDSSDPMQVRTHSQTTLRPLLRRAKQPSNTKLPNPYGTAATTFKGRRRVLGWAAAGTLTLLTTTLLLLS